MKDTISIEPSSKGILVSELKPKEIVRSTFLVRRKALHTAQNGKPYLGLTLGDRSGSVDTRIWEDAEAVAATFQEGDVVAVFGKTHVFQNRLQLVVQSLAPIPPQEANLQDYLPRVDLDIEALYAELLGIFEKMENPWIRDLSLSLLRDPEISERYKVCPAAKTIHHAFLGGLLFHSLSVIRLVDSVVPNYQNLNRDILIFGAAFHDFGKIYELSYDGNFGYTDVGQLVGHITIGVTLVDRKLRTLPGFPEALEWQLKHIILSHHGKLEFGSPKRPQTLEAEILHRLDDLDSKIHSIQTHIESEKNNARWTSYHKGYDQYYYKPTPAAEASEPEAPSEA